MGCGRKTRSTESTASRGKAVSLAWGRALSGIHTVLAVGLDLPAVLCAVWSVDLMSYTQGAWAEPTELASWGWGWESALLETSWETSDAH